MCPLCQRSIANVLTANLGNSANRPKLVGVIMADQAAGIRGPIVGDRNRAVRSYNVSVEIHQSLS